MMFIKIEVMTQLSHNSRQTETPLLYIFQTAKHIYIMLQPLVWKKSLK